MVANKRRSDASNPLQRRPMTTSLRFIAAAVAAGGEDTGTWVRRRCNHTSMSDEDADAHRPSMRGDANTR